MSTDEKEYRHPSYGLIGFSRVNGDPGQLFGSSLEKHHGFIELRISPGVRRHSLSHDSYMDEGRPFITVWLSAAQFAEFITTPNMGVGVPCTINSLGGKHIEKAPVERTEVEEVRDGFKDTTNELARYMTSFARRMEDVFSKGTPPSKKDKEDLRGAYANIVQHVKSNMPFIVDQFHEATERMVTAAKAEADAWLTRVLVAAGIKSLNEGTVKVEAPPKQLQDGNRT